MSRYRSVLRIPDLPCHFGPMPTPDNFAGLPNVLPFELAIDMDLGLLRQIPSPGLDDVMHRAYQHGNVMGTPLADDAFGGAYADDFLDFINRAAIKGRERLQILEVGAGAGYISHKLIEAGHQVTSIEPGSAYRHYWERYGLNVLNTFFPTPQAPGPYDVVVSYAVLEHIEDTVAFIRAMGEHLAPGGQIVAAVPNDGEEILAGDPGMLVHEHYLYFRPPAFRRLLEAGGVEVETLEEAKYSRVLFATGRPGNPAREPMSASELEIYKSYATKFERFRQAVGDALDQNARAGRTLGIYCPSRSLAVLPADIDARFFDDAAYNKDKYFPPFRRPIENKADLFAKPVDEMWIMSRSFSDVIARNIAPAMEGRLVRTIEEFE